MKVYKVVNNSSYAGEYVDSYWLNELKAEQRVADLNKEYFDIEYYDVEAIEVEE